MKPWHITPIIIGASLLVVLLVESCVGITNHAYRMGYDDAKTGKPSMLGGGK